MTCDPASYDERRQLEGLDRQALARHQLEKLNRLLSDVLPRNDFYARKLGECATPVSSLAELASWPMTSKEEILPERESDLPLNLTYSLDQYVRYHQTSGTRGRPMRVLDTARDWQWWIDCWQFVLDAAGISPSDRVLCGFSFGPFIGFWSAFDALIARGVMAIPAGGMSTVARLDLIRRAAATALFCTPTYALHMAEVAAENRFHLDQLPVQRIVVAGEPGGSVPAMRERIERVWNATVFDHAGGTEIGPWGYADQQRRGLHVLESEFIAEFLSVETGAPAEEGELSHLVLTTLGRTGCPLIRYRTGDLVRPFWSKPEAGSTVAAPRADQDTTLASPPVAPVARSQNRANNFVRLEGGVLGRADDMLIIRGINVFPSSIEQILHSFPEVVEYRMTARRRGVMDELLIEVEDHLMQPDRIAAELRLKLGLKVEVQCVSAMSLPRFEGKGRRFVDLRDV